MISSRALPVLICFALLGCGESDVQSGVNLQGTWYFQTQENPTMLLGRHIITQREDDVLITYCSRLTYALRFEDGVLVDPLGAPYYLQPRGSDRLVGLGDTGTQSEVVKVSSQVTFDSGGLSVFAEGMEDLIAFQGVCAEERAGRAGALDGTEIASRVVTMTAPYQDSFIRIQIAFHALSAGAYSVLNLDPFVHDPSSVLMDIDSPVYGNTFGDAGRVSVASGSVTVVTSEAGDFRIEGLMSTTVGRTISFSAAVVLNK